MLPKTIAPMLAQFTEKPFDSDQYLFEIKWDGTRAVAFIHGNGHYHLQNRRFLKIESRYPELAGVLNDFPAGTMLDGEVVVIRDGKPSFNKLQQRDSISDPLKIEILSKRLPAVFVAFDVMFADGKNICAWPLWRRKEKLQSLCEGKDCSHLLLSDHVVQHGMAYFQQIEKHGLEGVMAKYLTGSYQPGKRSEYWQKIKVSQEGIFDVIGFEQRAGEAVVSALALGSWEGDRWYYWGKVGSGFNEEQRAAMYEHLSRLPKLEPIPINAPDGLQWVQPRLKAKIRYLEVTNSGRLRSPSFKGFIKT